MTAPDDHRIGPLDGHLTDEEQETEDGPVAHIVRTLPGGRGGQGAGGSVEGTPLEAPCGHVWVPCDPKQLPVCQKCKDIYGMYRDFNDGWTIPDGCGTPRM